MTEEMLTGTIDAKFECVCGHPVQSHNLESAKNGHWLIVDCVVTKCGCKRFTIMVPKPRKAMMVYGITGDYK